MPYLEYLGKPAEGFYNPGDRATKAIEAEKYRLRSLRQTIDDINMVFSATAGESADLQNALAPKFHTDIRHDPKANHEITLGQTQEQTLLVTPRGIRLYAISEGMLKEQSLATLSDDSLRILLPHDIFQTSIDLKNRVDDIIAPLLLSRLAR